jgi:LysR family hydrogen peroxide-inducible transcriptional activator
MKYPNLALQTEEMLTETIKDKLLKAEVDMGILAGPVQDADLLEVPLYHERFLAYVSPENPTFSQENIRVENLLEQPVWIIRDGLRQLRPDDMRDGRFTYDRFFEGGRVGILIQVVSDNGGITIIPETHAGFLDHSQQFCLRPIVNPVPSRTISLVIRSDYIHEAKLNAVVDAVRHIIPGTLQENMVRNGRLRL